MSNFTKNAFAGALVPMAFVTGCTVSSEAAPTSFVSSATATPSATETKVDRGNILSDTTCIALSDLAMALGGKGYPVVNIDPNSPTLGATITTKAETANSAVLNSLDEVTNEAGETGYAGNMQTMDAFSVTRATDEATQRTYMYLGGKTMLEVVDPKMQPKLKELIGLADQARGEVKRVMTEYCKDPAYPNPNPKSPFDQ